MRKRASLNLAMTAAVSLLALAGGVKPAAALKCTNTTYKCVDAVTKQVRTCTTTTCTNDTGDIVSIDTVVEKQGDTGAPPKPKIPLPKAPATGGVKQ